MRALSAPLTSLHPQVNNNKAIWLRNTNEVTEEEYEKFYKALAKDYDGPLAHSHFRAEGDVEFRAVLFFPKHGDPGQYDNYYSKGAGLKLYVRRVFISDEFDDLLPRYLSFLKGIVDSDTLPLNVSRETLQQHSSLKTIKKKLVRKALDVMRKLAEEDEEQKEAEEVRSSASCVRACACPRARRNPPLLRPARIASVRL